MSWLSAAFQWFAGNGRYHDLIHCMGRDYLWIGLTVALDLLVATGYGLIAIHWWKNARHLPQSPAKRALSNLRNIFLFCGICGYIFIPIKMVWPAWRLYDGFMIALAYFTWRYAVGAKDLKVVYTELGRSKQLEDDLKESREEARRKGFFLNALSHDLRTPLNALLLQANFAELSLRNGNAAVVADALHEIKTAARATSELLDSLLEYGKVDWSDTANSFEQLEVEAVLKEVARRFEREAQEKHLQLRVGSSARGLTLRTDRVKLERILANLVSNAVKFTAAGGVRLDAQRAGQGVEIHVIDTGIGIGPTARGRLFDEFFQLHNHERDPRKGVGLGLAIARRLVGQLKGEIEVQSAAGSGSRFTVVLPGLVEAGPELGAAAAGLVSGDAVAFVATGPKSGAGDKAKCAAIGR
jgi:signal transduction histidine kinase